MYRWNLIKDALKSSIRTSDDFEKVVKVYNPKYATVWNFSALHKLFNHDSSPDEVKFFFDTLLPKIVQLALRLPELFQNPIPLLKQHTNHSISMTQEQAACLLANAFLCTFPMRNAIKQNSEFSSFGEINFNRLFGSEGQHVVEKLKCIINYFKRVLHDNPMSTDVITFQRRCINPNYKWEDSQVRLSSIKFLVTSKDKIEDGHGMLQVDFANRFVGGGVLGNGCVQEEIRFIISPELIVAKLFTESLEDEEALLMIGCEQFNSYSGYSSSFKFTGDYNFETPVDRSKRKMCRVVAIDALKFNNNLEQFDERAIRRDLNKAFAGFEKDHESDYAPVATGLWGCGIYRGHPMRSALIQFMACAVSGRNLMMTTFSNNRAESEITEIYKFLHAKNVTVGQLYKALRRYKSEGNPDNPNDLGNFIKKHFKMRYVHNGRIQKTYRNFPANRHQIIPLRRPPRVPQRNTNPSFFVRKLNQFKNWLSQITTGRSRLRTGRNFDEV